MPGATPFRREGDYWSVVFDGRTVRARDLKGMRYLARLLVEPGRELHVLNLVAAESGAASREGAVPRSALGDAGEMLDPQAKGRIAVASSRSRRTSTKRPPPVMTSEPRRPTRSASSSSKSSPAPLAWAAGPDPPRPPPSGRE